jgi:hypothetical protein
MHYYLYEIRDNINGKIYIGVHKTKNLDDGYMGSGLIITRAIKKYGVENFTKTILEYFGTSEEMFAREKEIVTEEFLLREDTYNLRRGGHGGWEYINKNVINGFCDIEVAKKARIRTDEILKEKHGSNWRTVVSKMGNTCESILKRKETLRKRDIKFSANHLNTPEIIEKRKTSFRVNGSHVGVKNSQYGRRWATNGTSIIRLEKDEVLPNGFFYGKTLKIKKEKEVDLKIEEYKRLSPFCRNKECLKELTYKQWLKNITSCSKSCSNKTRHLIPISECNIQF